MGKRGMALQTTWLDCQIICHVSTWMDSDQHRRLIGNDVILVR